MWFRYPSRKHDWVLKGLNLKIYPNQTVALVGESGCGKSTIVSLLLRFYDVNEGWILLDGVDIREYDLRYLRKAMGLVMQEPILFNYSISENIMYGNKEAKNSDIKEAATIANALEFIDSNNIHNTSDESISGLHNNFVKYKDNLERLMGKKVY